MKRGYVHIYAHSLFSFSALNVYLNQSCVVLFQNNLNNLDQGIYFGGLNPLLIAESVWCFKYSLTT